MKKWLFLLLGLYLTGFGLLGAVEVPMTGKDFVLGKFKNGNVDYSASFEDGILTVIVEKTPNIPNATIGALLNVPAKTFVGKGVKFSAEIRYEGIDTDAQSRHAGGKIMTTNCRDGVYNFYGTGAVRGTKTEWTPISCLVHFDAGQLSAHGIFGMQQAWGKIQFRNITYEIFEPVPMTTYKAPKDFKCKYTARVTKDIPRRGVMTPPWQKFCEKDIRDLAKWNVNLVRYQIVDGIKDSTDLKEYGKWFRDALAHLDSLMPVLKECGIKVIIDMHVVPGSRYGKDGAALGKDSSHFRMMHEKLYRDAFLQCWQYVAKRYKGNKQVYAFDLCNEPIQHGKVEYSFWQLQYDAAKVIRSIDPEVPIMIESNHMADPVFFEMVPMPFANMIYTVHVYTPGNYNFQGIDNKDYARNYPAKAYSYKDSGWSKERLKKAITAVREFQLKYGAKIQVGEFSVIRWAPGGEDYLNDLASIFDEYNWDWTYHAFREWDGWSLEHEGGPWNMKHTGDSARRQVMLKFYGKNQK